MLLLVELLIYEFLGKCIQGVHLGISVGVYTWRPVGITTNKTMVHLGEGGVGWLKV